MKKNPTERFYVLFITSAAMTFIGIGVIALSFFANIYFLQYLGLGILFFSAGLSIFANRIVKKAINDEYGQVKKQVDSQFDNLRKILNGNTDGQNTASTSDKQ